jgi:hypothetical protein
MNKNRLPSYFEFINERLLTENPGGMNPPKNIYQDLHDLVETLEAKYEGGRKFFDALDDNIKNVTNSDMIIELVKPFKNEYIAGSGGFGKTLFELHKKNMFKCKGIIIFNGKIATEGKKVEGYYPKDFDITGKEFVFIDDSYFSGGTARAIKAYMNDKDSEMKQVAVIYDGSKKKTEFVKSFFRYYK